MTAASAARAKLPRSLPAKEATSGAAIRTVKGTHALTLWKGGKALGAEPQMEVPIMQGLFVVDIMAQWRGRQVVVEVDGPMHFSSNAPRHPLCSTVARDRVVVTKGLVEVV
ncbi:RAP domain-containing protein [Haematococcus lacustris]|uniref:RAP domain-containing protein n=1 Tax=Haematococcus lacustris TaxID=44745 RepID=A0A699Z8K9_HAELA|nr:RAP domain-containing protein [Haematococcus lacustris]